MPDQLSQLIQVHEGRVKRNGNHVVYDDATGSPIIDGMHVNGNPTVGYGRNLAGKGLLEEEAEMLLKNDITECVSILTKELSWFHQVDDVRAAVMIDLCLNMGWLTFSDFSELFNFMALRDYSGAANDLTKTAWYREAHGGTPGSRGTHAYTMLMTGQWPTI